MFSAVHSSILGKPNCTKSNPYIPSTIGTLDVYFHPIKNPSGTVNYVALVEKDDENVVIPSNMVLDNDDISDDENESVNEYEKTTGKNDIFSLDNDYINTFYIGSITVVGLYILFRILDKTR